MQNETPGMLKTIDLFDKLFKELTSQTNTPETDINSTVDIDDDTQDTNNV